MQNIKKMAVILGMIGMIGMEKFAAVQAADGTILKLAIREELAPYEYQEEGEWKGIHVELAELMAEEMGIQLEYCAVLSEKTEDAVKTQQADMVMGAALPDKETLQELRFSDGYLDVTNVLIVTEEHKQWDVDELKTKRIGMVERFPGIILETGVTDAVMKWYTNEQEAVKALEEKNIDVLILEKYCAQYQVQKKESFVILEELPTEYEFAIAMPEDAEKLAEEVNEALHTMKETGELDKIIEKYLGEEERIVQE